jgi:hypothetical protein
MNFSNHFYIKISFWLCLAFLIGQEPFLEIRPFVKPTFEQYSSRNHVDHHYPSSNIQDGIFLRFDGAEFTNDVIFPDCPSGSSCYDGHAGTDYYMPLNTPILAPAGGYVLWSAFSPPADPCPGGIEPNGDQGTIIIAHGNGYFSCYLHMNPPLNVSVGETVETGDTLGFNGNSGCAINAHLHFEIRKENWYFDTSEPWAINPYGWWGNDGDPIEEIRGNRSEWLWVSTELVDDGDNGFQRYYGPDWTYLNTGYEDDSWSAPVVYTVDDSRHYAIWVPTLEAAGEYDIQAFLPEGLNAATGAKYEIIVQNEDGTNSKTIVLIDQNSGTGDFLTITTLDLPAGSKSSVILRDFVDATSTGDYVIFDALKFVNTELKIPDEQLVPKNFKLYPPFPNPFNPSVTLRYETFLSSDVKIDIYNIRGEKINSYHQQNVQPGIHDFHWTAISASGAIIPSGIYFYTIESNGIVHSKKLIFMQ